MMNRLKSSIEYITSGWLAGALAKMSTVHVYRYIHTFDSHFKKLVFDSLFLLVVSLEIDFFQLFQKFLLIPVGTCRVFFSLSSTEDGLPKK